MGRLSNWFYGSEEIATPAINNLDLRHGSEGSAGGTSPLPGIVPPSRPTLDVITPETALQIGVVYRSVNIISTTMSQLHLHVHKNDRELPLPTLIRQPNIDTSLHRFIEETVYSLALYGNAYWRIYGDIASPMNLEVLAPEAVTITRHEKTGQKVYWYGNENLTGKVKHLKLNSVPGKDYGIGPVQAAKGELTAALMLKRFSESWFDVSGVPTGVLTTDQSLNPTQAAAFADAWNQFIKQHGGTVVLSQGMSYEALRIKPAEAQFLEVQRENNLNIARLFGIPSMHLTVEMGGTSMTYMNLEQSNILFLQNTLAKYMTEIETALSEMLPRGQHVHFALDDLLRMDTKTKWEVNKLKVELGYTNSDELRAADGLDPLPSAGNEEKEGEAH